MTFSICMRTVYRPQNYCQRTVKRLADVGAMCHSSVLGFHISHGEGITPNRNGARALLRAANDNPDWIIFLEDDIDVIDDFIPSTQRWLKRFELPNILFYPLGSFYQHMTQPLHDKGAWDMPLPLFYGSQAVVLRKRDAIDFAVWLNNRGFQDVKGRDTEFDLNLTRWHQERCPSREFTRTPAPSFVDHIGEHSLMGDFSRTGHMLDFAGRKWSFNG